MLIYIFSFLGFFAVLMLSIPSGFLAVQQYSGTYQTDKDAEEMFSLANITAFTNTASFQIIFPAGHQESAGLPAGHYIEMGFDWYATVAAVRARHVKDVWFWQEYEALDILPPYSDSVAFDDKITSADELEALWENEIENASFCAWARSGYSCNAFIYPNETGDSITDAYWDGVLNFTISYEVDWNATRINAWNLLSQIMLFQSPDLAMGEGIHNTILNAFIAIPIWIMIIILAVKIIFAFYPTSSGVQD